MPKQSTSFIGIIRVERIEAEGVAADQIDDISDLLDAPDDDRWKSDNRIPTVQRLPIGEADTIEADLVQLTQQLEAEFRQLVSQMTA